MVHKRNMARRSLNSTTDTISVALSSDHHHGTPRSPRGAKQPACSPQRFPGRVGPYVVDRAVIRYGLIHRYCLPRGGVTYPTVTVVVCHVGQ